MDPTTGQTRYSEFFPVAAVDNRSSDGSLRTLVEVLKKVLETAGGDLWCRDVFIPGQLLAFAVLYLDDVPENKTGELLYRVRNLFHAGQEIRPSAEDLRLDNSALLPYAESQWFTFSLEGGAFAAFNAPETPFFRGTLPDHLRNQYFLLFLLALQQRFTLIMLSGEITRHWLDEEHPVGLEQRVARFQAVRRRLLEFTARGYFAQVMQQEHHHRCFRKWQDIFQIDRLYQEVSDEAREIHAYLLMNRTEALRNLAERQQEHIKGVERRLNLIGLVIGIPALAMSYLQVVGGIAAMKAALVGLGALAAGALLFGGLEYLAARRRPRAHEDDRPDRDGPNPARDSSQVEDSRF